jgi:hypothetical protein
MSVKVSPRLQRKLAVVNDATHYCSLATEITVYFTIWQPLLSHLDVLVNVAHAIAEARFILNYMSPAITKKYFHTGSPLNQVSMGSHLSGA